MYRIIPEQELAGSGLHWSPQGVEVWWKEGQWKWAAVGHRKVWTDRDEKTRGILGLHHEVESPINGIGVGGGAPTSRQFRTKSKSGKSTTDNRTGRIMRNIYTSFSPL